VKQIPAILAVTTIANGSANTIVVSTRLNHIASGSKPVKYEQYGSSSNSSLPYTIIIIRTIEGTMKRTLYPANRNVCKLSNTGIGVNNRIILIARRTWTPSPSDTQHLACVMTRHLSTAIAVTPHDEMQLAVFTSISDNEQMPSGKLCADMRPIRVAQPKFIITLK
jgi:hypothetical protein